MIAPPGDIEYACIFALPTPTDCSKAGAVCDCEAGALNDNPLCQANPNDGGKLTLQVAAKAYPGVKNLAIAKGMKDQGVVGSICPKQLVDPTQADYGYRPAIKGLVDAVQPRLQTHVAGQCLPMQLTPDASGQVACSVIEASNSPTCDCAALGKIPVTAADQCAVDAAKEDPLYQEAKWSCFCEVPQASGAALKDCQDDVTVQSTTNGWCYVDATASPAVGNPALVASCPSSERRQVRFVGTGAPDSNATLFVACQ